MCPACFFAASAVYWTQFQKKAERTWHETRIASTTGASSKWPFCVTFSYYALLCLYTGSAEASEAGFLAVLIIALLIDAVAYACYLFFLSKAEENMGKLWFAFILAYVLASSDKLAIVWQMLAANAGTH